MGAWVVGVTQPSRERRVARALKQRGFEHYLPKFKTRRRRTALLFPRYIFAGPAEEWREVRGIDGISRLLRSGDHPAVIPDEALNEIRSREDRDGFVKLPAKARFKLGQRVKVAFGPFVGIVGTYRGSAKRGSCERISLALGDVLLPAGNLVAD